jgi:hypothetical protein
MSAKPHHHAVAAAFWAACAITVAAQPYNVWFKLVACFLLIAIGIAALCRALVSEEYAAGPLHGWPEPRTIAQHRAAHEADTAASRQAGARSRSYLDVVMQHANARKEPMTKNAGVDATRRVLLTHLRYLPREVDGSVSEAPIMFSADLRQLEAFRAFGDNGAIAVALCETGIIGVDEIDAEREWFYAYFSSQQRARAFVDELAHMVAMEEGTT